MIYDVLIIGGGLSGLSVARHLTVDFKGNNFLVLEARDRVGGRINTLKTRDGASVEMGATWWFPPFKNLLNAMHSMDLKLMPQYMKGYCFYQNTLGVRKKRMCDDEEMFRIEGGTGNLTSTILKSIDAKKVLLGQVVTSIAKVEGGLEVVTRDKTYYAKRVVSTIPPQLLAHSVTFSPPLPKTVMKVMKETHTWMGESMKGAVSYKRPFWREAGLAGTLFSHVGPFLQLYDQTSTNEDRFALVGFLNDSIANLPYVERKAKVVDQLVQVFGADAKHPLDYKDTYWGVEEYTMHSLGVITQKHNNNGHSDYSLTYMDKTLYIGGAETSSWAGGYMEGAVTSAQNIIKRIKDDIKKQRSN